MKQEICCTCGTVFTIPDDLQRTREENGKYFWCPNGHQQRYSPSKNKILRDEIKELNEIITSLRSNVQWEESRADENHEAHLYEIRRRTGCQGMIKRLQNEIKRLKEKS